MFSIYHFFTTPFLDFFLINIFPLFSNFLKKDLSFIQNCPHLVDAHGWISFDIDGSDSKDS